MITGNHLHLHTHVRHKDRLIYFLFFPVIVFALLIFYLTMINIRTSQEKQAYSEQESSVLGTEDRPITLPNY